MALPPVCFVDFQTQYAYHATVETQPSALIVHFELATQLPHPYFLTLDGREITVFLNDCPLDSSQRKLDVTNCLHPGHNEIRIELKATSTIYQVGVQADFNPFTGKEPLGRDLSLSPRGDRVDPFRASHKSH